MIWYTATCQDCTPVLPQPFTAAALRDTWAAEHQAATRHRVILSHAHTQDPPPDRPVELGPGAVYWAPLGAALDDPASWELLGEIAPPPPRPRRPVLGPEGLAQVFRAGRAELRHPAGRTRRQVLRAAHRAMAIERARRLRGEAAAQFVAHETEPPEGQP